MMRSRRQSMTFDLPSGTWLGGKYEVLRKLATGGMAEIYLARTSGTAGFEKLVVIKRILPTVVDDPHFVQMFLDEARLAAQLRHPNIADVYEVGIDDGAPFFAMEFLHGQDIRTIRFAAHARKEAVPLAISLAIVYGTASALDYAHNLVGPDGAPLHLVHRDVSASNVLVGYEGAVKLIDFGIARASSRQHKTQVGMLKGKIPYMSPEQCRGEALDRRSDLFSLGVVMYELTTGRRPFVGESDFSIMDQIVYQAAPPPSQLVHGYPPELEAIVLRLLARRREERYQSAEELLHDFDPYIGQHRLYVSAKAMSKYMRTMFADRLAGFENPELDEVTRAQHLIATLTGESQNSQILTPLSSFPEPLPVSPESAPVIAPRVQLDAPGLVDTPPPPLVVRRRRRWLAPALLGVAAIGIGGFVGLQIVHRRAAEPAELAAKEQPAAPPAAPAGPAAAGPAPRVTDVIELPAVVEAKPAVVEAKPAVVEAKPAVTEAKPTADTVPVVSAPGKGRPGGQRPPPRPPKQTVVKPPKQAEPSKPPKQTEPSKPPKPPDRAKDPSWDRNDNDSPFLPN
jgi:serine/threonine protein kinase